MYLEAKVTSSKAGSTTNNAESKPVPFIFQRLPIQCSVCATNPLVGLMATDDTNLNIALCPMCRNIFTFSVTTIKSGEKGEIEISNKRLLQLAPEDISKYACLECGRRKSIKKMREGNAVWECLECNALFFPQEVTEAANNKRINSMTPEQKEDMLEKNRRKRERDFEKKVETTLQLKPHLADALKTVADFYKKQQDG